MTTSRILEEANSKILPHSAWRN